MNTLGQLEQLPHEEGVMAADEAEVLFREARRRRRVRILRTLGAVVVLVGLLILGSHVFGGSPNHPEGGHGRAPGSKAAPGTQSRTRTNAKGSYVTMSMIGVSDSRVIWAADGDALYVATGQQPAWRQATPPNLTGVSLPIDIGGLRAVGANDLWLPIFDVPGLVPMPNDGSSRGEGVDRSTDGGQTWSFSALPGCLQSCGANLSVSFVNALDGFAATGPGSPGSTSLLFSTNDGGATWTEVGSMPMLGSIAVGGPAPGNQVEFTSMVDGWEMTGPSGSGINGQPTSRGGQLYRTMNGGRTWSRVGGLPPGVPYSLPNFFGREDGVVLSNPDGTSQGLPVIYSTTDAGHSWVSHQLPSISSLATLSPSGIGTRFAATSASTWKVYVGSALYTTTNAGRSWRKIRPTPSLGINSVSSVTFWSNSDGLALSTPPHCAVRVSSSEDVTHAGCFPSLTTTTDGGAQWTPVNP